MLYSLKARAAVLAVMFIGMTAGALMGGTLAAVTQIQVFPTISGVCLGTGVGGLLGLYIGEHVGQRVDAW